MASIKFHLPRLFSIFSEFYSVSFIHTPSCSDNFPSFCCVLLKLRGLNDEPADILSYSNYRINMQSHYHFVSLQVIHYKWFTTSNSIQKIRLPTDRLTIWPFQHFSNQISREPLCHNAVGQSETAHEIASLGLCLTLVSWLSTLLGTTQ